MTRDEILSLKPGRELDTKIEIEVFGLKPSKTTPGWVVEGVRARPPRPFSTDIAAAFEAETKVIEKDPSMYVHALASVVFGYSQVQDISDIRKMCMLIHATPEQRCKAALLAVMDGEDEHEP